MIVIDENKNKEWATVKRLDCERTAAYFIFIISKDTICKLRCWIKKKECENRRRCVKDGEEEEKARQDWQGNHHFCFLCTLTLWLALLFKPGPALPLTEPEFAASLSRARWMRSGSWVPSGSFNPVASTIRITRVPGEDTFSDRVPPSLVSTDSSALTSEPLEGTESLGSTF